MEDKKESVKKDSICYVFVSAIIGYVSETGKEIKLPKCRTNDCFAVTMKKSAQRRRKHYALAVVRWSQKISPRRRPPSRGRGTAKLYSAGDGHYLYLQTQFGEDRCTQFRVIVVTDPPTHPHTPTHPPTDRTDYNTLRRS